MDALVQPTRSLLHSPTAKAKKRFYAWVSNLPKQRFLYLTSHKCPVIICTETSQRCKFYRIKTNGNGTSSSASSPPHSPSLSSPSVAPSPVAPHLITMKAQKHIQSGCSSHGCTSKRPAQDCPNKACAAHCRALGGCHRHKVDRAMRSKPFIHAATSECNPQAVPHLQHNPDPSHGEKSSQPVPVIDPVLLQLLQTPVSSSANPLPVPSIEPPSSIPAANPSPVPSIESSSSIPESSQPRFATIVPPSSLGPQPSSKYASQMPNVFTKQSHQAQSCIESRRIQEAQCMAAERRIKDEVTFVVYRLVSFPWHLLLLDV